MKKIILFISLLVFLSGCNAKYELEFNDEFLNEKIQLKLENSMEREIELLKNRPVYAIFNSNSQKLYNIDYNEGLFDFTATYEYTFNTSNFNQSVFNNNCFDAFSFTKQEENYILSTSKGFNCMTLEYFSAESIEMTLTTNHSVIESNADKIDGKKYIWNINQDNASEKEIYIKFGKVKEQTIFEFLLEFINNNRFIVIVFSVLAICVIGSVSAIVVIGKKNNEID